MMQVYYNRVGWISGIAFFGAFLLTFWPSRLRMVVAAVLWTIGMLTITGLIAYSQSMQGAIAHAFNSSRAFPLFGWLAPLISIVLAVIECVLLFPWVKQKRALDVGKILFLAVVPAFLVLFAIPSWRESFSPFPLGIQWLGYPLLWFRIRERQPPHSI
jgi:hypothetical protein